MLTAYRVTTLDRLGANFSGFLIKIEKKNIHENASENIVCQTAAIFSRQR